MNALEANKSFDLLFRSHEIRPPDPESSKFVIDAQSFSNSFEGGSWVSEKICDGVLYFCVLLHFYDPIFLKSLVGVHEMPTCYCDEGNYRKL